MSDLRNLSRGPLLKWCFCSIKQVDPSRETAEAERRLVDDFAIVADDVGWGEGVVGAVDVCAECWRFGALIKHLALGVGAHFVGAGIDDGGIHHRRGRHMASFNSDVFRSKVVDKHRLAVFVHGPVVLFSWLDHPRSYLWTFTNLFAEL